MEEAPPPADGPAALASMDLDRDDDQRWPVIASVVLALLLPVAVILSWPQGVGSAAGGTPTWDPTELTPVRPATNLGGLPLVMVVEETARDLPQFWAEQAPRLWGEEWRPVVNVEAYLLREGSYPTCGPTLDELAEARMQAYYCAATDTVAWDAEELFPAIYGWFGDAAPAVVMAHEWAHAAQDRMVARQTTVVSELQADCLAGAWLAEAPPALRPAAEDFLDRAASFFAWIGDPADTHLAIEERHGTGGERLRSFGTGYRQGPAACIVSPGRLAGP
ncbi:MAG: neutral zinc metallopeptidase [Actinomycetota bacterium]